MFKLKIILAGLLFSPWAFALSGSGLNVSLAGDMLYSHGLSKDAPQGDNMIMRGAEIMFYAPIDHLFSGTLSAAAHEENGVTVFELHELFLESNKILPATRIKAGRFFLGVGRLNQIHQHDWPFIRAPKVHQNFFAKEAVFDSGVEVGHLLPVNFYLDFSWGITSGYRYGHAHTAGAKPQTPTHYLRLETFKSFSSTEGIKLGLNYLGRRDQKNNKFRIAGFDLTGKWREGRQIKYMLQSEFWYRNQEDLRGDIREQVGAYIFNRTDLSHTLSLGLRLDGYNDLSKRNSLTGKKINNIEYACALELTFKPSEFSTIRPGISHSFMREEGKTIEKDTRIEMQLVFILGTHPAHDF